MRSPIRFAAALSAILFILLLGSCQKIGDFIVFPRNGDDDFKACNVVRITTGAAKELVYDFTYNKRGDPTSILASLNSESDVWFKYDKKHRLEMMWGKPVLPPEAGIDFLFLSKYVHDNKGRIIIDSSFFSGTFESVANGTAFLVSVETFEYDATGRITRETHVSFPGGVSGVANYVYDSHGNLVQPGWTYTDKFAMARTNKIWMFINRNYSVNDPQTWATYNRYHLPLQTLPGQGYFSFLPGVFIGPSTVEYECD